ncbi:hypothetical protein M8494_00465 [Serratia ureilytica]
MRITRRLNIATNFTASSPLYFPCWWRRGAIQMGGLMQITSAFGGTGCAVVVHRRI